MPDEQGQDSPEPAAPEPRALTLRDWRAAKQDVRGVFARLEAAGFVALAGAGSTQPEGFDACAETLVARGGRVADLVGFCYYTRQDAHSARGKGWLPLAFWGAPDGSTGPMVRAGEAVVRAFREAGFTVSWDGSEHTRPVLDLTRPRATHP